jgi:hypothetical protein
VLMARLCCWGQATILRATSFMPRGGRIQGCSFPEAPRGLDLWTAGFGARIGANLAKKRIGGPKLGLKAPGFEKSARG